MYHEKDHTHSVFRIICDDMSERQSIIFSDFDKDLTDQYGPRKYTIVLHTGKTFSTKEGIDYLSAAPFLKTIYETKDFETAMDRLLSKKDHETF